jgi:hypothetical protein
MKDTIERRSFPKVAAITTAMCAAFALSGCGGGDARPGSVADKFTRSAAEANKGNAASIKIEGQSVVLSSDLKTVTVVTPPVTWNADGTMPQGTTRLVSREQLASELKALAPGAYTTLPWGKETLTLSTGTVTDMAGNGKFAIGRWTAGSDSAGQSYNGNQGRVWAVGAPVDVTLAEGEKMSCELVAATRPTTSDGNTAPGILRGATAVLTGETDWLGRAANVASITLQYSIGSDINRTFTRLAEVGGMSLDRASRSSLATAFLGPDASRPYLVMSYGVHAPTAGLINGLAVLSCS